MAGTSSLQGRPNATERPEPSASELSARRVFQIAALSAVDAGRVDSLLMVEHSGDGSCDPFETIDAVVLQPEDVLKVASDPVPGLKVEVNS